VKSGLTTRCTDEGRAVWKPRPSQVISVWTVAGNSAVTMRADAMLSLDPQHWCSWNFWMQDATRQPVAEIMLSSWRERGAVSTGGLEYKVSRQGFTGPFILAGQGVEVARAVKPSVFRHEFSISHGGAEYTLKRASVWRREYNLFLVEQKLGSVAPEAWFSRRAKVALPDDLAIVLKAFVAWLTLLMWKRDADSSA
jgi:hypothetical protein